MSDSRNKHYGQRDRGRADARPAPRERAPHENAANLIFGRNAVRELLASGRDIDKIYLQKGEREGSVLRLIGEASARRIPMTELERRKLDELAAGGAHQGIIAVAAEHDYRTVEDMLALAEQRGEKPLLVIADGILDPQNLGALIRVAECAGAHGIIIPKRRAVGLTALVSKTSAGAIEYLPIARVTNLVTTIQELKERGFWIYAADMDGAPYYETDLRGSAAIVLGGEGEGVSRLVKENCDFVVSIPLHGKVGSMNVTSAAAVLLCEAAKQRSV